MGRKSATVLLLFAWLLPRPCNAQTSDDQEGCRVQQDRFSVHADYVLWWLREGRVPPLLTTSSPASAGLLDKSDTRVLYGDDRLPTRHHNRFNGIRMDVGYWLDDEHCLGIETSAFFLERDSTHFKAESDGSLVLARPYINAQDGTQASEIIAGPSPLGQRDGGLVGYSRVELFGQDVNFKLPLLTSEACRVELLAGACFLQMRDRVDLTAVSHLVADPSTLLGLTDHLRIEDRFYGGQIGLRGELASGRWLLSLTGQVAPGATDATLRAFGDRTFQTPTERIETPGGLAVQPSNAGRVTHTQFDVVSQVRVNASYRLTERLSIVAGYTFLYWANSLRAGDQIDLEVNPTLTTATPTGPSRPTLPFRTDGFWAQGLNVGVQFTW